MRRLFNEIRGSKYHDIKMAWDRMRQDLVNAVIFQKQFVLTMYNALECRFKDNHIMTTFELLNLINMLFKEVSLANWRGWLNCYMANIELSVKLKEEMHDIISKLCCNHDRVLCN